jgi:hypothetical protein
MTASKIANPISASLTNVSQIKVARVNGPKPSANKANAQNAANGPSALIGKIGANAMSRVIRTSRAVIP